jgi:hypothetical protein
MVMDHAEALERIEIAAAEPDGLERLMAGDTPDGAAVAGHLAGCPSCVSELARIKRTAEVAREVIRAEPDPALRDRTLAFVRAVGRDRSGAEAGAGAPAPVAPAPVVLPTAVTVGEPIPIGGARRGSVNRLGWLAAAAAVILVVGAAGFYAGGATTRGDGTARESTVALLSETAATALRIGAQPDAQTVELTATAAYPDSTGSLAFSATTGELVAVAWDLAPEAPGEQYGCWVEVNGQRERLGRMYWAGDMWTWAGPVQGLGELPAGAVFGVSLIPAGGGPGEPALTGKL